MKSKWSMQTQTQRNVASTPVMPIPAAEIFPPNNNQELQQRALSMIHEFSAHIGSPGLFIAIRTPARSKKLTTGSLRADWGDFWDRGRGIAFARRFSSRTQRSIEFGYFGDKQKLAVFADMAERVWRTAVPLSWQRLLPHGNSNGSNSARDDFALSLFCQPARFMEELPLNWRGEGAYAELVADMNLGKLLDVVGCLCDSPERETATIERLLQGFSSRPDYLYIAISGDVFHAAVGYLQHLAIYWADVDRGIFSEEPIPRNELETLHLKYLQSDDSKRDRMAYELLKDQKKTHSEIREIINRTIREQDWKSTTLDSSQALTAAAKRWAERSPEPQPPPDKRKPGRRQSPRRKSKKPI